MVFLSIFEFFDKLHRLGMWLPMTAATAPMETASNTRPPAGGKASDVSAVIKPAERARTCSWLKVRSRRPVERRSSAARSVSLERVAMADVAAIEIVAIDDRSAVGDVGVVVIDC